MHLLTFWRPGRPVKWLSMSGITGAFAPMLSTPRVTAVREALAFVMAFALPTFFEVPINIDWQHIIIGSRMTRMVGRMSRTWK